MNSTSHFLFNGLSLILIDLLLAGDNALIIAMAVRALPARERRIGITAGATIAVVLRVALTALAAELLRVEYVQLAGGVLVVWIALKVLVDASDPPEAAPTPRHFLQAIWYIVLADLTMSTDNILAIAGASKGDVRLIVFGLCVSIPFVVFSSNLLAKVMDRYPITIYLGAAILGRVGGEMAMTDPVVVRALHPSEAMQYVVEGVLIVALIVAGKWIGSARRQAHSAV
ncbi:MAG TPA: TerC family protein [Bryobacteraceae bacterium]|nr:TerC family protein [Bryobacteraceae bacterium]